MAPDPNEAMLLEQINYRALLPVAQAMPGYELILRDDVILSSSELLPVPDTTHACLLKAAPERADDLITEVVDYFSGKGLLPAIYLSPACTPLDLPERLARRGFVAQESEEAWVILDDLDLFKFYARHPQFSVEPIEPDDALVFAEVFLVAMDQPVEFAPMLAELLHPSVGLPTISHYLGWFDGQVIGTISLIKHDTYGIVGSTSVLPDFRRSKAAVELFFAVFSEAQQQGLTRLFAQTELGSTAERLLLANHFRRAFTRRPYVFAS
jgi:hypothetical protein